MREVPADEVAHTAVAVSHSGRVVFTGATSGTIRAIKYPLPIQKDWIMYQAHCGPVTKVGLNAGVTPCGREHTEPTKSITTEPDLNRGMFSCQCLCHVNHRVTQRESPLTLCVLRWWSPTMISSCWQRLKTAVCPCGRSLIRRDEDWRATGRSSTQKRFLSPSQTWRKRSVCVFACRHFVRTTSSNTS